MSVIAVEKVFNNKHLNNTNEGMEKFRDYLGGKFEKLLIAHSKEDQDKSKVFAIQIMGIYGYSALWFIAYRSWLEEKITTEQLFKAFPTFGVGEITIPEICTAELGTFHGQANRLLELGRTQWAMLSKHGGK